MWNPPLLDEELGVRGLGAVRGGRGVLGAGHRRRPDDLLHEVAQGRRADPPPLARPARRPSWPSGSRPTAPATRPQQRQEIQRRLSAGELLGVVATDALELGIDIGELDAAICVTFPGTVASLRQMWGRAGRRGRGLAVYIAGEDALDQFFCRHPDEFLGRPVEAAILDPDSPEIYAEHLLCAAHEAPLTDADAEILGPDWRSYAEELAEAGFLRERATGFVPRRADDYPAARAALRSASARQLRADRRRARARCSGRSRRRARTRPSTRARSTCTWGAPTTCSSSISPPAARCSSRSAATTSRRPSARA